MWAGRFWLAWKPIIILRLWNDRIGEGDASLFSNKGAASVLVVFMMIILVTFGTLSLTAALANERLGAKTVEWMTEYYTLDAQAERLCMAVDACLLSAEEAVVSALPGNGFDLAYYQAARQALDAMAADMPQMEISGEGDALRVEIRLSEGEEPGDQQLTVVLGLARPVFRLVRDMAGQGFWQRSEDFVKRYTVLKWQQWQVSFEQNDDLELWDGIIPI
jgi:hypothetical protein